MNGEPFEVDILALPERADTRPRMSRSTSMSGIAARNRIAVRMSTYDGSWPNQAVSGRPERVLRVRASTQLRGEKRSGFVRASAASSRSKPPWRAMQSIWAPSQLVRHRPLSGGLPSATRFWCAASVVRRAALRLLPGLPDILHPLFDVAGPPDKPRCHTSSARHPVRGTHTPSLRALDLVPLGSGTGHGPSRPEPCDSPTSHSRAPNRC
jgi:hypothetical protein